MPEHIDTDADQPPLSSTSPDEGIEEAELSPAEAIKAYSAAITENPNDAEAYFNRGQAHYNAGDLAAALEDYNTALRIDPTMAEAHAQRGYCLYAAGEFAAAAQDFRAYSRLVPEDPIGHNNTGFLNLLMGRVSQAEAAWHEATARPDAPAYAHAGHAIALLRMRRRRVASERYRQAIALDPRWQNDLQAAADEVNWPEAMIEAAQEILAQIDES
jgi:Flp pilus assembly protein TadD